MIIHEITYFSLTKECILYFPTIGIVTFIGLFIYASFLYPGGSQADLQSVGFSWQHNYWCNLMNIEAMNGTANVARPYAIIAMVILCLSLALFFFLFSKTLVKSIFWQKTISLSGFLSMGTALFMFTDYHDVATIIASIFGVFAVLGVIKTVYSSNTNYFKISGLCCIALLVLNNYIYYTHSYIEYLPLLQKITFIVVLGWIIALNLSMQKIAR